MAFTLAEDCFPIAKASTGGGDLRTGSRKVRLPGPGQEAHDPQ